MQETVTVDGDKVTDLTEVEPRDNVPAGGVDDGGEPVKGEKSSKTAKKSKKEVVKETDQQENRAGTATAVAP